jgi:protein-S-isoprenylcysteine O-methyltransferase Ste14
VVIQWVCLYGPLVSAGLLAAWIRPDRLHATGLLFSLAWNAAMLPWLDGLAQWAGFWSYHSAGPAIGGMPLALYFGWVLAWGVVAPLLGHALGNRPWIAAALMVAIDLRVMPEMTPVLRLRDDWWFGEIGVVIGLLVPSMLLSSWTAIRTKTGMRCVMLVPAFGGIFLGIPLLVECHDLRGLLGRWQQQTDLAKIIYVFLASVFCLPGLTAVRDLAKSGDGTPVPLDPPCRLVTHGIYAYVRNPMQLSMTSLLLLEGCFLASVWPFVLAGLGVVYSEGLARWSENEDMRERFGDSWDRYRSSVRAWFPHFHPRIGESCGIWFDRSCKPCSEVEGWLRSMNPRQIEFHDANDWPAGGLERVTWHHPASGRTESGVCAMAMAFQHIDLRWAVIGWFAGLPGISHVLQICVDAAGGGRRMERN